MPVGHHRLYIDSSSPPYLWAESDDLTSWERVDPQTHYDKQLQNTLKKASEVDSYVKELLEAFLPEAGSSASDADIADGKSFWEDSFWKTSVKQLLGELKEQPAACAKMAKIDVLLAQLKVCRAFVESIVQQDGKFKLDCPRNEQLQNEFWRSAWGLLRLIENTFDRTLKLQEAFFVDIREEIHGQTNLMCETAGVAIVVGSSVCVSATCFQSVTELNHIFATPLLLATAGAASVVVGILVATALVGMYAAIQVQCGSTPVSTTNGHEQFQDVELTPAQLQKMHEFFNDVFKKAVREAEQATPATKTPSTACEETSKDGSFVQLLRSACLVWPDA